MKNLNLISQHIQELDDNFLPQELVEKSYTTIYRQVRTSHLSLVEKIIGQARAMKRTDETQMSADHSYDEGLEDFALLLEQGLEEVKEKIK